MTLFTSLLTAFKALLSLRSGRADICVATLMANRSELGRERVDRPVRKHDADPDPDRSEPDVQRGPGGVRQAVLDAYNKQELPFDTLAARLSEQTGLSPSSLVQISFRAPGWLSPAAELSKMTVRLFGYEEGRTVMPIDRAWLLMMLRETSPGIKSGLCEYKGYICSRPDGRAELGRGLQEVSGEGGREARTCELWLAWLDL